MKIKTFGKIYWFFRAFALTSVMLFCLLLLLMGFLEGYTKMQNTITGEELKIIENKNNRIYILKRDICSADVLDVFKID